MIVRRMAKYSHVLLPLIIVLAISGLVTGMKAMPASDSRSPDVSNASAGSDPSVTCIPFGLYGDITTSPLVDRLSDTSDNLTFVGTTNGLYVVAPGGKLHHFLYSPFGIKHIALVDDITGDGLREVVVALDDTQVPALRCYDGATWEKLWQFAPTARIWDDLWVERQLLISNLKVTGDGGSQGVMITSGRCVLSIDAKDGTEQWRFSAPSALWRIVTLADLNGDGADEAFAGSNDGLLCWLSARTGKVQWQTKLPKHDGINYNHVNHQVSDIIVLNEESGKVAVASGDGWAQMYDLVQKKRVWDTRVFEEVSPSYQLSDYLLMSPTADITGDGLAEVLLAKTPFDSQFEYSAYNVSSQAALCDSAGNKLWVKDASVCSGIGLETGFFEGKPVFLHKGNQGITLIDVKDGESVLHTIPLDALNGAGVIMRQPGGNGYLSFSSDDDLAAISATGELLWHYPRITSVKAKSGNFVGDTTEDVLFWGESGTQQSSGNIPVYDIDGKTMYITEPAYPPQGQDPEARLLQMMDGATRAMAWSYEVPYGEFKSIGGLMGIQVTPDLVGSDGIQDIIGYRQDTVFIFSGKDGACSSFAAGQPIASLEVICNGSSGNALAVGVSGGLMVFDATGTPLWTTTSAEWIGDGSGRFMALEDVNSDNVSDLAVISTANITVLKSVVATDNYQLHFTLQAEADYSISEVESVPDSNNDGVRDLACIQRAQEKQQGEQYVQPPNPLLSKISLVDGKELFKVQLPAYWSACALACGDFNGDGLADSLFAAYMDSGPKLQILSGKDGAILRTHPVNTNPMERRDGSELQFKNIGDVDNDGADDLVYHTDSYDSIEIDYSKGYSYTYTGHEEMQWSIVVYSVAKDSTLNCIPVTPLFKMGYTGETYVTMLPADVDADGHLEVIVKVFEPSMPSYDPYTNPVYFGSGSPQYLALVDVKSGRRLAGFTGFDAASMSLFESHQVGILGVAARGGACFLSIGSGLQVTSPADGARTRPTVGVKWEGPTDGDFSQVFVDGVRNDLTNGFESDLYLARGNHTIFVRSVDECGRISYGPSDLSAPVDIKVTPSPWKPVLLVLSLLVLIAIILLLFYARARRAWRARRRAAK